MKRDFYLKLTITILLLSVAIQSCGTRPGENAREKVIGGTPVTNSEFDAVVAFMRDEMTICTGTLITENIVLTAAHCFEKATSNGSAALSVMRVVGGNGRKLMSERPSSSIVSAKVHPNFWRDHRGAIDFAWVRIDPPMKTVKPATLPFSRDESDRLIAAAKQTTIVGYGLSDLIPRGPGLPPASGVKLWADTPIKFRTGVEVFAGNRDADTCSGDSGGPAFIRTQKSRAHPDGLVLTGITSRGPMPCANDYEAGAYGLTVEAVCWLRSSAGYKVNDPILRDFCIREAAQGGSSPVDDIVMTQPLKEACMSSAISEAARADLRVLLAAARMQGPPTAQSCAALETFLTETTKLNLSSRHLLR